MVNDWLYGCIVGWSVHLNWYEHIIYMLNVHVFVWMVKEHCCWKWFCYYSFRISYGLAVYAIAFSARSCVNVILTSRRYITHNTLQPEHCREPMRANFILYFDRSSRLVCIELHSISSIMIRGHVIHTIRVFIYNVQSHLFIEIHNSMAGWLANIILTVDWRALA